MFNVDAAGSEMPGDFEASFGGLVRDVEGAAVATPAAILHWAIMQLPLLTEPMYTVLYFTRSNYKHYIHKF